MSELRPGVLRLVCITPGDRSPSSTLALVKSGLAGGVSAVLLRERAVAPELLLSLAHDLSILCREAGALLLVSNDIDLAEACEADGVHLGYGGPDVAAARRQAPRCLVGRSAHWPLTSEDRAADFVTLSPCAATPHSLPRSLLTAEQLSKAAADPELGPVVALGGLDAETVRGLPANVEGVAVIRALSQAADATLAAQELLRALDSRADCPDSSPSQEAPAR
ncbi:MAG: thiamine-phosphate diphosphorylase [Pseudohongiellaceae bacterium]